MPGVENGNQTKVLHIIEDLESGGAERVLINLVLGLDRRLYTPVVCCLRKKGRLADELESQSVPVFVMHKRHKIDFALLYRLQKFIRRQQIDIVHTHVFTANLWGRLAARAAAVPVVISHEHSTFTVDHSVYRRIEKFMNRQTDCTVTVSEQLRHRLQDEAGLREKTLRTIYNGLNLPANGADAGETHGLRRSLGLEKFEQVVGTVGRLDPRKNYPLLLKAFAALLPRFPKAGLLIVGSGPEEANLKQLAVSLDLTEKIVFAGHRNDVGHLLKLFSVFCLTSRTEGISMALLEAMHAEVPVVCTRVGGAPEIIPDRSYGLLVPTDDAPAVTQALTETLDREAETRAQAKNAARRVREVFSQTAMVDRVERLYRELTGKI